MDNPRVLAVDLDGTLLNSDLLFESFWSALATRWTTPLLAAHALTSGRAALKRKLAGLSHIEVEQLPYNEDVIAFVRSWRESGGKCILVTASDQQIAQRIADHLGLFDEVHGSQGTTNLKGSHKARFLEERYRDVGFSYIGDHASDMKVWQNANRKIAVAPGRNLRRRLVDLDGNAEFLDRPKPTFRTYMRAIRWHQWSKNVLVFVPMVAGHRFDPAMVLNSLLAFMSFCLIASGIYVLNDLLDLNADRAHPRKRLRPFASGAIPIAQAGWLCAGCLAIGSLVALSLGPWFALTMAIYGLLTTAYSLNLKRRAVIDICVLAMLYTVRILAGSVATTIPLSEWLLAFSLFFFLSLAAIKRQAELIDMASAGKLKAHGRGYFIDDLPVVSQIATSSGFVSALVMALYVNSPAVATLYRHPQMLLGICIVLIYWISRINMMTHRGFMHDDPIVFAAKDPNSLVCGGLVGLCALAAALP